MAKTKAELTKAVRDLEEQRKQQYRRIQELERDCDEWKELCTERSSQVLALRAENQDLRVKVDAAEMVMRKAQEECKAVQRNYDQEREGHLRTQRNRYEKGERIRALEKLLVHNGKAIGALSELAAEKYKNDELPF